MVIFCFFIRVFILDFAGRLSNMKLIPRFRCLRDTVSIILQSPIARPPSGRVYLIYEWNYRIIVYKIWTSYVDRSTWPEEKSLSWESNLSAGRRSGFFFFGIILSILINFSQFQREPLFKRCNTAGLGFHEIDDGIASVEILSQYCV